MAQAPPDSLVRYDNPVLVSTSITNAQARGKKQAPANAMEKTRKDKEKRDQDYLNSILPPREYNEAGNLWVRYVSPQPATQVDVINLQDHLDAAIQRSQARETGICPHREELFSQCFDELIRQIVINCAERGFLLVRVRDEIKMTISAYQTLYESSIAYGMRKALMSEQGKNEMTQNISDLETACREHDQDITHLQEQIEEIIRKDEETAQREEKAHKDQVEYLNDLNHDYKEELETLLSTPQK